MLYSFVFIHVPWPGESIKSISDDIRARELGSSGSSAGSRRFQMLSGAKSPLPAPVGGCTAQQSALLVGAVATPDDDGRGGAAGLVAWCLAVSRRRHVRSARRRLARHAFDLQCA